MTQKRLKKWLEPFGVTDPFSKLRLEGYLSLKPDYRYGALALLKVEGKEAPQRILATPKLRYPFDRTGAFHFPSVKQIDIYEKIDGTNIFVYQFKDGQGNIYTIVTMSSTGQVKTFNYKYEPKIYKAARL